MELEDGHAFIPDEECKQENENEGTFQGINIPDKYLNTSPASPAHLHHYYQAANFSLL
jgi:hypothetical protein